MNDGEIENGCPANLGDDHMMLSLLLIGAKQQRAEEVESYESWTKQGMWKKQ